MYIAEAALLVWLAEAPEPLAEFVPDEIAVALLKLLETLLRPEPTADDAELIRDDAAEDAEDTAEDTLLARLEAELAAEETASLPLLVAEAAGALLEPETAAHC